MSFLMNTLKNIKSNVFATSFQPELPKEGLQPLVFPNPDKIGVYTNKIHYLRKYLLDELPKKKFSMEFMVPVDQRNKPNYDIFMSPMDVGTIKERVHNFYYSNVMELILDFNLMINNCLIYNHPEDRVYRDGIKLDKFFKRVVEKMPFGDEKPSTKDPQMLCRQNFIKTFPDATIHQCEEKQTLLNSAIKQEEDESVANCLSSRFENVWRKVNYQQYRSVQQLNYEVSSGFKEIFSDIESVQNIFKPKVEKKVTRKVAKKRSIKDFIEKLKDVDLSQTHDQKTYIEIESTAKILKQKY